MKQRRAFIRWNYIGLLHNLSDIKDRIITLLPVALCLQDSNLRHKYRNIVRNSVLRHDGEKKSRLPGSIGIIVKGGIPALVHTLECRLEAVVAIIHTFKIITVCSVYVEPHLN